MKSLVTPANIKAVLIESQRFEILRDFDSIAAILKSVWFNFLEEPETRGLSKETKAEFLRVCGNFLVCYGRAKDFHEFQPKAKDLLTKAFVLFKKLNDVQGQAKTASNIALSYCYSDRADAAYIITTEAEKLFSKDSADPVYLQLKTTQVISLSFDMKYDSCIEIIDEIIDRIEASENEYLPILFFNQCGYVFSHSGSYDNAVKMYLKAVEFCEKANDERSLYQATNNLANALRKAGFPKLAFEYICRSIALVKKFEDFGYLPNFEDTKANVLFALGEADSALQVINQTIFKLSKKNDARTMCEALWTKVEILFSVGKRSEAMLVYTQLGEFARTELSEDIAKSYAEKIFEKLSPKVEPVKKRLPAEITRFYPANEKLINLPGEEHKLFFVPARFASAVGPRKNLVVCTIDIKENPLILYCEETEKYFLGTVEIETFYGDDFYTLKLSDAEEKPFCPEDNTIAGHVAAFAEYNEKELIFEYFKQT